jgi:hypothetical protein
MDAALPHPAEEFDAAKAVFESGFFQGLQTISGKGDVLQRYFVYFHEVGFVISGDLTRHLDTTPQDVLSNG